MSLSVRLDHQRSDFRLSVEFDAPPGVTALFGRSGAGKTTIVNAVAGLFRPQSGRIALEGEVLFDAASAISLPPHQRNIGYVFQDARLFPHMDVRKNLNYGARFARRRAKGPGFDQVVALLGLEALLRRAPSDLSGGEKQRVAIGRALLSGPRLLLMDEPLASLDEARKGEILPYLERIRDEAGLPILYVSHSVPEVARLATTVVALHQGRVIRSGPASDMLADPDIVQVLGIRQMGAVLTGRIVAHHADGLTEMAVADQRLFLPRVSAPEGAPIRVRVAAQDVILANDRPIGLSALNVLEARIVAIRQGEGPGVVVQLALGGDRLLARITRRSAQALDLTEGKPVYAIVKTVSVAPADVGRVR